jgi:hypothetical protein
MKDSQKSEENSYSYTFPINENQMLDETVFVLSLSQVSAPEFQKSLMAESYRPHCMQEEYPASKKKVTSLSRAGFVAPPIPSFQGTERVLHLCTSANRLGKPAE